MRLAAALALLLVGVGCIETTTERPYACSPDAGNLEYQCPGGWICGLEGYCRDPNEQGAWKCERDSGFGCAPGWFCTLEGSCRSRDAGGPFACTRSNPNGDPKDGGAPNDCGNPEWWCGHDGVCHKVGEAKPYACASDFDCEASWRCGPRGVCVALSTDQFSGTGLAPPAPFELVSPLIGAQGATHLAIGPGNYVRPDGGYSAPPAALVVFPDGGMTAYLRSYPSGVPDGVLDIGKLDVIHGAPRFDGVKDLAFLVDILSYRAYFLRTAADGGTSFDIARADFSSGTPNLTAAQPIMGVPSDSKLRVSGHILGPAAVLKPFDISVHYWNNKVASTIVPVPYGAGGSRTFDMAWLSAPFLTGSFVLSSYQGMFIIRDVPEAIDAGTWYALGGEGAENRACGTPGLPSGLRHEVRELKSFGSNVLASHALEIRADGGTSATVSVHYVHLDDWHSLGGGNGSLTAFPEVYADGGCEGPAKNMTRVLGPCQPCPTYQQLVDFHPAIFEGSIFNAALDVRCRQLTPEGEQIDRTYLLTRDQGIGVAGCQRTLLRVDSADARFIYQSANSQRLARADSVRGSIKVGDIEFNATSMLMDSPAEVVLEQPDGGDAIFVGSGFIAMPLAQGLLTVPNEEPTGTVATIPGKPGWMVRTGGVFEIEELRPRSADGGLLPMRITRTIASTRSDSLVGTPNTFGALLTGADGGFELVVASSDSVYSTDIGGALDGGASEGVLELRNVPSPRANMLSFAGGRPPPGSPYWALAYAHTQNGVFEVRAETRTRWRSSDVVLPGDVVSVFSNNEQARAGLSTGQVVALPSQLIIAEALPAEAQPAVSFAGVCAQPWVLSRGGLYKLEPVAGSPIGRWTKVEVNPPASYAHLNATSADLFARGRLHYQGRDFYLFLADGTTYRSRVSCPP